MPQQTVHDILDKIKRYATSQHEKGRHFERLMAKFLVTDSVQSQVFEQVWSWKDWPELEAMSEQYQFNQQDPGIDLVGQLREDGSFCAIQCKMYDDARHLHAEDFARFILTSQAACFGSSMVIATGGDFTGKLEHDLDNAGVIRLGLEDLESSNVDWSLWDPDRLDLPTIPKKTLRPYQKAALLAVRGVDEAGEPVHFTDDLDQESVGGLRNADRGKLIMACGTGKTLTGLRIVEDLVPQDHGMVLFAVPSITLLSQTLREWANQAEVPMRFFAVCSDTGIGKQDEDMRVHDLAFPATTVSGKLVSAVKKPFEGITAILTTYQSMDVIREAQEAGLPEFDLVLCDEAHRTTGVQLSEQAKASIITRAKKKAEAEGKTYNTRSAADESTAFLMVHDNKLIHAKKRLYMTATPRIYGEKTKKKADESQAAVYSMDNPDWYGKTLHTLKFGEAIEEEILADFKVVIVAIRQEEMDRIANVVGLENGKGAASRFVAKMIGAWKGLSKAGITMASGAPAFESDEPPMRSAVAFSHTIETSKDLRDTFQIVVDAYLKEYKSEDDMGTTCAFRHVDGTMTANHRRAELDWLAEADDSGCRVLTNAKCLSEGVDVPSLDAVLFFDARDSMVDVVQSVGRVMRRSDATGKKFGYIILPVGIPSDMLNDLDGFISKDDQFKNIWKVLKALRAHDERLVDDSEFRRRVKVISGESRPRNDRPKGNDNNFELELTPINIDQLSESVYAVIPDKLGDREYWSGWSKEVAETAKDVRSRLLSILDSRSEAKTSFKAFLDEIHQTMNPAIAEADAVDMLVQHLITRPVFSALFPDESFVKNNPVSRAMQHIVEILDEHVLDSETDHLSKFYANVRRRIALAKSDVSRQTVIKHLYDTFFQSAFPKLAENLGIVYTPVEVVDFIIHSANFALKQEFGVALGDAGVDILDPFTGTGTFITRLIQSGLIPPERLADKFAHEIHANEIVLLAYYIASLNIESAYQDVVGQHVPFDGIVLGDTFMMGEGHKQGNLEGFFAENSARAKRQDAKDIRVIISNPPYNSGQDNANDNNQNLKYDALDASIRDTYAAHSTATLKNSLYDSYIRAFRWASNRIKDLGVICFVSNGGWIDGNTMDGFRKSLAEEFTSVYVFNLRGNQRTSGELSRKEGGKVFGSGSRTPIAITLLVKNPSKAGQCAIHYRDIGDYLSREEKLAIISEMESVKNVPWERITPNENHDWINQRSEDFGSFMAIGDKSGEEKQTLFAIYSNGVKTNRDAWVYNFSQSHLRENMEKTASFYEREKKRLHGISGELQDLVHYDPKQIKWEREMLLYLQRGVALNLTDDRFLVAAYRPFTKSNFCFGTIINNCVYKMPSIFPSAHHQNLAISVTGTGSSKEFSCLIVDILPDLEVISKGQCFPLYHYEKPQATSGQNVDLFDEPADANVDADGYTRKDAITDTALADYRAHYHDDSISKEDIFYYVYGILHSPEYRERYANDLKKMLPRIPFAPDFWAFSKAGRDLAYWHLNYEQVYPYGGLEIIIKDSARNLPPFSLYRVEKMAFASLGGREKDKSTIQYNGYIAIKGIPLEAYDYVVNGKPAIAWIMDRYQVTTDKDSDIKNDPNDWCREHDDPAYIFNLVQRVVRVSVETVRIIGSLPSLADKT